MLRKISDESIAKLLGVTTRSTSMVVYGLGDCYYEQAYAALARDYDAYCYSEGKNSWDPVLHNADIRGNLTDGSFLNDYICKAVITNLIILNYELTLINLPVIPLIFIIGYKGKSFETNIDVTREFNCTFVLGTTNRELRRCYKLYSEFNGKFKEVAEATFKFVRLEQDEKDNGLFHLKPEKSPMNNPAWLEKWQKYQNMKRPRSEHEKSNWRATLFKKVSLVESLHSGIKFNSPQAK